jgi:DNA-binding CsgD family transcriptional regulator
MREPVFVGRRAERAELTSAFETAVDAGPGVVAVVGEAGVGKSALVSVFCTELVGRGVTVARGYAYEAEWSSPFAPWAPVLVALGHELPVARGSGGGSPGGSSTLASADERVRMFESVARTIARAAEDALICLVLEDTHWADADSLSLLVHVARALSGAPCLFVLTYREAEGAAHLPLVRAVAELRREARFRRVELSRFSREDVEAYVAARGTSVAAELIDLLARETAGNALYVRELHRHIVEERGARETAPQSVVDLTRHRLARLSSPTAGTLRAASAFTGVIAVDVLAAATNETEAVVQERLEEARRAGFVESVSAGYELTHAIVRRAIYDELGPAVAARTHRALALAFERARGARAAADVVGQYYASRALPGAEAAVPHVHAAANAASAAAAHDRAAQLLRMGASLATEAPVEERAKIARALALAEAAALMPDESRRSTERAVALSQEAGMPDAAAGTFLESAARAIKEAGAPPMVWELLAEKALPMFGDRGEGWARTALLFERYVDVASGRINVGRFLGPDADAVAVARASADEATVMLAESPYLPRTRAETEALVSRAKHWKNQGAVLRALDIAQRDMYHRQNDCGAALVLLREMLALAERIGSLPAQAEARYGMAKCLAITGDIAQAQAIAEDVPGAIARLGTGHRLQAIALVAMNGVLGYFAGTDFAPLARAATDFLAQPTARKTPLGLVLAGFAALGLSLSASKRETSDWIAALLPILRASEPTMYNYLAAVQLTAAAAWHTDAAEHAPPLLDLALSAPSGIGALPSSALELEIARLQTLCGDHSSARASFEAARRVLDARAHRAPRAIVDHDDGVARRRSGDRDGARALFETALSSFETLGMEPWIERARTNLGESPPVRRALPDGLTKREAEVLRLVALGKANKEIAASLFLSVLTVQRHVANIYAKIGAAGRADATRYALAHGLTEP